MCPAVPSSLWPPTLCPPTRPRWVSLPSAQGSAALPAHPASVMGSDLLPGEVGHWGQRSDPDTAAPLFAQPASGSRKHTPSWGAGPVLVSMSPPEAPAYSLWMKLHSTDWQTTGPRKCEAISGCLPNSTNCGLNITVLKFLYV